MADGLKEAVAEAHALVDPHIVGAKHVRIRVVTLRRVLAALSAAEARERVKDEQIAKLLAAMDWLDDPFVDKTTPTGEIRSRIAFMIADRDRALAPETPHAE